MFPSLSKCAPGTTVKSEFTAEFNFTLDISSDIDVLVNGALFGSRPIGISAGDLVAAEVQTPNAFLEHIITAYTIDGVNSSFAAVTKSEHYVAFRYETADTRWWQLTPAGGHCISYRNDLGNTTVIRDLGYNAIPVIDEYVGIPDPLTSTIYFYNNRGVLIENLLMPSPPVQCSKFISDQENFFIVSCTNGYIYRVNADLEILEQEFLRGGEPIGRTVIPPDWLFELSFESDVPFKGAFTRANYFAIDEADPQPKYVSCTGEYIWIGGASRAWLLNPAFEIIKEFTTDGLCVGIQATHGMAIVTTKYGTVEVISEDQENILLYSGGWLSNPVIFGNSVAVADSATSVLLFFDLDTFAKTEIPLGDFAASYLSVTDEYIFIAGHDSNIVKKYDGTGFTDFSFADKVTWVQPLRDGLIASHFLRSSTVLYHDGQQTVVPFNMAALTSGLTLAGSIPQRIISLGESDIHAVVPEGVTYWSDGTVGGTINTGSFFSAAVKVESEGIHRFPLLLGDIALDLQVTGISQTFIPKNVEIPLLEIKDGLAQHDFFITENYEPCRASIDYGYLLKNFNSYTGDVLNPGDVLTICIPFGNSTAPVISTVTLGVARFYVCVDAGGGTAVVHSRSDSMLNSASSFAHTVDEPGQYYFPLSWPVLETVEMNLSGRTITNLGGNFDPLHPAQNLVSFSSADVEDVCARVPASAGLFDIYFDAGSPQTLLSYDIMPRWGDLEITTMVNDANGVPQPVVQTIQTTIETPVNFKIVASNDTVAWTEIASFNSVSAVGWQRDTYRQFQFTNSSAYRYWRLQNATTQGTGVSISRWKIGGKRAELVIKINGSPTTAGINYLASGDVISVDLANSPRIYDSRVVKIAGINNIEFRSTSSSFKAINYLDLGTLVEPYVRQVYDCAAQTITGIPDGATVVAKDPFIQFKVGSTGDFTDTAAVQDGNQLIVRKIVRNLFESETKIYQQQTDPLFGDEVFVDIGSLQITNMQTSGALRDASLNSIFLSSAGTSKDAGVGGIELSSDVIAVAGYNYAEVTDTFDVSLSKNNFYATDKFLSWLNFNNTFIGADSPTLEKQVAVNSCVSDVLETLPQEFVFYTADSWGARKQIDPAAIFADCLPTEVNNMLNYSTDENAVKYKIADPANFYEKRAIESLVIVGASGVNSYSPRIFKLEKYTDNFTSAQVFSRLLAQQESNFYETGVFDRFTSEPTDIEHSRYAAYVHINNTELIDSFMQKIESADARVLDSCQVYVIQHASIIENAFTPVDATPVAKVLDGFSLIINSENMLDLFSAAELKDSENTYILDTAQPLRIDDIIWTTTDINNYGAFDTEQAAAAAAESAGHTPAVVLPITGTGSFTYRKLSDLSRVCGLVPVSSIYALARLIQGG